MDVEDGADERQQRPAWKKRKFGAQKKPVILDRAGRKALRARRQSGKAFNDAVTDAKQLWNRARMKDLKPSVRAELISQLAEKMTGKTRLVVRRHDASRVVQTIVQYGTDEQRRAVFEELKEMLLALSQSQYSYFLVLKLLRYGDAALQADVVKALQKRVLRLGTHMVGSSVIEHLYQKTYKPSHRPRLLACFYGVQFQLLAESRDAKLRDVVAAHPDKAADLLLRVHDVLVKIADKDLLGMGYAQALIWEYLQCAPTKDVASFISNYRDASVHMLGTRAGACCVTYGIIFGDNKDRKKIIKSFKGSVADAAMSTYGYLPLAAMLQCVDDTTLVGKVVVKELRTALVDLLSEKAAHKVLLALLARHSPHYFSPTDLAVLRARELLVEAAGGDGDGDDDDDDGEEEKKEDGAEPAVLPGASRKDAALRQSELLAGLQPSLEELLADSTGVLPYMRRAAGVVQAYASCFPDSALLPAAAEATVRLGEQLGEEKELCQLLRRMLADEAAADRARLAASLAEQAGELLAQWALGNWSSGVVANLLHCDDADVASAVKEAVKPVKRRLRTAARKNKGCQLVLDAL
eukprot:PLAT11661.6.p1 GENE.PLAT11661.6~~PLAT11661.6.p1  ORF type:complete len:611 (-),score=278.93 PLAT11661.6:117-1856(-)